MFRACFASGRMECSGRRSTSSGHCLGAQGSAAPKLDTQVQCISDLCFRVLFRGIWEQTCQGCTQLPMRMIIEFDSPSVSCPRENVVAIVLAPLMSTPCCCDCRLAFTELEAQTVMAWLHQHYPGPVRLLHIGFPTPFATRDASDSQSGEPEASWVDKPVSVHQKSDFMVQVRCQPHMPVWQCRIWASRPRDGTIPDALPGMIKIALTCCSMRAQIRNVGCMDMCKSHQCSLAMLTASNALMHCTEASAWHCKPGAQSA